MQPIQQDAVIETVEAYAQHAPLPQALETQLSLQGKQQFIQEYTTARNATESAYYAEADGDSTPGQRSRKFLGAMINPLIGRTVKDAEHFYETYGRLMRHAWLSISIGLFDDAIHQLVDAQARLNAAQANTVDTAWRLAMHRLTDSSGGLIVEIGTGRGNSVVRLARLLPHVRIVSITISPEQYEIVTRLIQRLSLTNVEIRRGDIFDPAVSDDLVGQADAVGAIEVTGHFPHERKAEGIGMFARMLKPGAPLSMLDSALIRQPGRFEESYYRNQSWYFGSRDVYARAFAEHGVHFSGYVDYTPSMLQTMRETAAVMRQHRPALRAEFGRLMALLWPQVPRLYIRTTEGKVAYVHIFGYKAQADRG